MPPENSSAITHREIANLAYLNWQKDGCLPGRDQAYWLEAEHQIKHTKHLLVTEKHPRTNGKTAAATKPKMTRKKTVAV